MPEEKSVKKARSFTDYLVDLAIVVFAFFCFIPIIAMLDIPFDPSSMVIMGIGFAWIMRQEIREMFQKAPPAAKADESGDLTDYPMNGHEFEHWVAAKMRFYGWDAKVTQGSGDQGLDIIAIKSGQMIGIQCKRFTGSVGNGAVQEAHAGRSYHGVKKTAVLTTGQYTRSAKDLSLRTGVVLLEVKDIPKMHEILGVELAFRSSSW